MENVPCTYVEIKCQLDATEVFIADLIACSTCFGHHYTHHQELKSIIQWLLRVVFCAVVFSSSWFGVQDAGILFPHINDDARSKSHQICTVYNIVFLKMKVRCSKHVEDKKN